MKYSFIVLILFIGTALISAQDKINTDEAANHIGESVTVIGTATQVTVVKSGITYINMDGEFPENKFTGVIFKRDSSLFEGIKKIEGLKIELTGKIEEYRGKPQIVIKNTDQLKVYLEQ